MNGKHLNPKMFASRTIAAAAGMLPKVDDCEADGALFP
jgi:hypothetical protein